MPVNWKTADAKERLLAALVASLLPNKVDYNKVARIYGQQTTYNAIEGQFRPIRKLAEKLLKEEGDRAASGAGAPQIPIRAPKRDSSGKPKDSTVTQGVITGRVSKSKSASKSATPKARKVAKIDEYVKSEEIDSGYDDDSFLDSYVDFAGECGSGPESNETFSANRYGENDKDLYSAL